MTFLWLSLGWVAAPILHLYRVNAGSFPPSAVARPLTALILLHAALYAALRLRLKDDRAGALLSAAWSLFFLYPVPARLLESVLPRQSDLFALFGFALAMAVVLKAGWRRKPAGTAWRTLVAAGALLGAFEAALFLPRLAARTVDGTGPTPRPAVRAAAPAAGAPHILYIVLDGYGSGDVLRARYGFDNEPFLRCLEADGFSVARRSRANYSHTVLSLSSSLNMDYLQSFGLPLGPGRDLTFLKPVLERNRVRRELRARGYRFVALESGYDLTELEEADRRVRITSRLTEFERGLIEPTPLAALARTSGLASLSPWRAHHRRVLGALEAIDRLAAEPRPLFVFAHVVCPHPPFVFDREGRFFGGTPGFFMSSGSDLVRPGLLTAPEHRAYYLAQMGFLNRRLEGLMDRLLQPGRPPCLIILQGDHGPDSGTFHHNPAATDLFERFGILLAVRFPRPAGLPPPEDLSPVNLFRLVLSREFGDDRPLLPERHYISDVDSPFEFIPVPAGSLRP